MSLTSIPATSTGLLLALVLCANDGILPLPRPPRLLDATVSRPLDRSSADGPGSWSISLFACARTAPVSWRSACSGESEGAAGVGAGALVTAVDAGDDGATWSVLLVVAASRCVLAFDTAVCRCVWCQLLCRTLFYDSRLEMTLQHAATRSNTLQKAAIRYDTMHHAAPPCNAGNDTDI